MKSVSRKFLIFCLLGVAVVVCGAGVAVVMSKQKPESNTVQGMTYKTTALDLGGKQYTLQIADTPAKQRLGLGGRANMMPRAGMLFVYTKPLENVCYWMKDMRFSLDIIWLDSNRQITMIQPSLSPATYPHSYCAAQPTRYVVELNAGVAHDQGLQTGQKLNLAL